MSHASSDGILAGSGAGSPTRGIAAAPLTGATRYLAAAAYTDKTFRDKAIEIGEDEFRARAPELGIDADAVLQHCAVARRRTAWRDALLCLPLIFLAVTGIVESVIAYPDEILYIVEAFSLPLLIVWITAAAIVFTEKFSTQHLTLTGKFSAGGRDLASNTSPAQTAVATPANVVMYGAFSPFVGSGYDIGGWSFTINLEQASLDADAPDEFTTTELYDSLRAGFLRLSIDGLSISDRLYVDGRSIRNDPRLLTNILSRPASRLAPELVETYYSKAERGIRHYL